MYNKLRDAKQVSLFFCLYNSWQCAWCITEGVYNVKRSDSKELLEIRAGNWTYDEIYNYAKEFDHKIKEAVKTSFLPEYVDKEKVSKIIMDIQDSIWYQTPLPKIKNKNKIKP